jgi:RNA polymerase sigma-70 factor (ECF subfamily)
MTDEELLTASANDRAAFGEFYERTERVVLGYFGAATRSADLAADLTAETFAAALSSVGRFDVRRGSARGCSMVAATRRSPRSCAVRRRWCVSGSAGVWDGCGAS